MKLRLLSSQVALAAMVLLNFGQPARADLLVQYDPTGPQLSGRPLSPSFVNPLVTAGNLSQVGLENFWNNTNVWPVGRISSSPTITLGDYLTFTVNSGGNAIMYQNLLYDKRSYRNDGATSASIRSSLDSFAADIDTIHPNPAAGDQALLFNLSTLPATAGSLTFRIYFYAAPAPGTNDWDDLVSTASGGNGLRLNGALAVVPEPSSLALVLAGGAGFGLYWWRRRQRTAEPAPKPSIVHQSDVRWPS